MTPNGHIVTMNYGEPRRSKQFLVILLVGICIAGGILWNGYRVQPIPGGFASGNGRIEAIEFDIVTKRAARISEILVHEGDTIEAGQVLAKMDSGDLEAALHEAEANIDKAEKQNAFIKAQIEECNGRLLLAKHDRERYAHALESNAVSRQAFDRAEAALTTAKARLDATGAQLAVSEAEARAALARKERLLVDIEDSVLTSVRGGRILYRLAEPGEVLAAGGKVLTALDLTDVYMTIYLPTRYSVRTRIGAEARILLDAIPDAVIPATVSFVAPEAQFTPREVETATEREKLMFRIKVQIDPELLQAHVEKVKTGIPGVAYVRLDPEIDWPETLEVMIPE